MNRVKFVIFIMLFSIFLYGEDNDNIIMLKITPNFKAKKTDLEILSTSLEMNLTKLGYTIISESIQEEALKEQKDQRKSDCYDDKCLVDTGKMLAARKLLIVSISKRKKTFFIKFKKINIETGLLEGSDFTVIDINYDDEVAHTKVSKVMSTLFVKKATDIKNLVNMLISTNKGAIIKLDGKIEGKSIVKKIVPKKEYKLEISKKHYETLTVMIDTNTKNHFNYRLKAISYDIEIDSRHKDAEFFVKEEGRFKKRITPFNISSNIDKPTSIKVCKRGYKILLLDIGIDQKKIDIDLVKKPKYKLTVENKQNFDFTYEETKNPCNYSRRGDGKEEMTLYEGNYTLRFTKPGYKSGYRYFSLYGDRRIRFYRERELKFSGNIQLINEYNYISDDISNRNHFHTGVLLNFETKFTESNDISAFAFGFLGDFFYSNKESLIFRFGFLPTLIKKGWFYTQVNIFGFGGYLDFQFYDKHILLTPLSIKLGLSIPLGDYFSIKLYGNASWLTEWFEDGRYENDGYQLSTGITLEARYR